MDSRRLIAYFEGIVLGFAAGAKLDLIELGNEVLFPVYAVSGGLSSKFIFYLRRPEAHVPQNGEDLGRESKCHYSVFAIELSYGMDVIQAVTHIEEQVARYNLMPALDSDGMVMHG